MIDDTARVPTVNSIMSVMASPNMELALVTATPVLYGEGAITTGPPINGGLTMTVLLERG